MPELPEAETIARGLDACLKGKVLGSVRVTNRNLRRPVNVRRLQREVPGRRVVGAGRRGKGVILELSGKRAILIQLGMSGACRVCREDAPVKRHEHVVVDVRGGNSFRFEDPRRFGMVEVFRHDCPTTVPDFLNRLGPEPIEPGFDGDYLFGKTRHRRCAIKNLLMDQRLVAGIGNIYASEALFLAGVRPRRAAGRLTRAECEEVVRASRRVLQKAISAGGTTISTFRGVDSETGRFHVALHVYGRAGEECKKCGTKVKRVIVSGRSTFYCPVCQR